MANEEHLARLKEGVAAWYNWRRAHPQVRPDLTKANLIGMDLGGVDLSGADLTEVTLTGTSLISANLIAADLTRATLYRAILIGAYLSDANLAQALLSEADLTNAWLEYTYLIRTDLYKAVLYRADLRSAILVKTSAKGAILDEAEIGRTTFGAVDLGEVRGLETVRHHGPSTISIDTFYLSRGNIPDVFLLGAGVPEDFITYMKSQVGRPFAFPSFLSAIRARTRSSETVSTLTCKIMECAAGLRRMMSRVAESYTSKSTKLSSTMNVCC
jgi:hypothetical protein